MDAERTAARAESGKKKTEKVSAVTKAAALKDKAAERGAEEEQGKQGAAEKKKTEGASQGIQGS